MTRLLTAEQVAAINARNRPRIVALLDKPDPIQPRGKPGRPKGSGKPRKPRRREAEVLAACILILEAHPAVALWWRQNTGGVKFGERYVKFSFKGASDLMAVLRGGRYLACECKAEREKPTTDQANFLDNVKDAGGIGIWCDDAAILQAELDGLRK